MSTGICIICREVTNTSGKIIFIIFFFKYYCTDKGIGSGLFILCVAVRLLPERLFSYFVLLTFLLLNTSYPVLANSVDQSRSVGF